MSILSERPRHGLRELAFRGLCVLVLWALLAGCGGPTTPTPAPSRPTPSPTPTLPPPPPLSAAGRRLAEANNRFGFDLLRQVTGLGTVTRPTSARPQGQATVSPLPAPAPGASPLPTPTRPRASLEEDVFLSPLSIALALQMTYNGAGGATAAEMAQVLHIQEMSLDQVNQAARELQDNLRAVPGVELAIANSLWLRQGWRLDPDFVARNRTYYDAGLEVLDFADPAAVDRINGWIAQATRDKVRKLLDEIQDEVLFLVNAIYFKGDWLEAFDPARTRPWDFRRADGTVKSVPMMFQEGIFPALFTEEFAAVALPYQGERIQMLVFVPAEDSGLDRFLARLTPGAWDEWMGRFQPQEISVGIPRFKVEFQRELNADLQALGMETAFDPHRADFLPMVPQDLRRGGTALYISLVKHGAVVEVNEEGTVAAAATIVGVAAESAPPSVVADRPFFVAIWDSHSQAILFMGAVVDPEPLP